jgi:hypothetical protein
MALAAVLASGRCGQPFLPFRFAAIRIRSAFRRMKPAASCWL